MDRLGCRFEVKFSASEEGVFGGYGSVFGNVDSHRDIVEKGAFSDSLAQSKQTGIWPAMLLMHGMGLSAEDELPIGVWTDMHEDDNGLYCEGKLALGTPRADTAYKLMKMTPRPALNGLSIGYRATKSKNHPKGSHPKGALRTLQSVQLGEVSLVTDPSNGLARVNSVKSLRDMTVREVEGLAWEVLGISRGEAKQMASLLKPMLALRDEDGDGGQEDVKQILKLRDLFSSK
jgi:HK97 family phage prohead protease